MVRTWPAPLELPRLEVEEVGLKSARCFLEAISWDRLHAGRANPDVPRRCVRARLASRSKRIGITRRARHSLEMRQCGAEVDARPPSGQLDERQHAALSLSYLVWSDRWSISWIHTRHSLKGERQCSKNTRIISSNSKLIIKNTFSREKAENRWVVFSWHDFMALISCNLP